MGCGVWEKEKDQERLQRLALAAGRMEVLGVPMGETWKEQVGVWTWAGWVEMPVRCLCPLHGQESLVPWYGECPGDDWSSATTGDGPAPGAPSLLCGWVTGEAWEPLVGFGVSGPWCILRPFPLASCGAPRLVCPGFHLCTWPQHCLSSSHPAVFAFVF